MISNAQVTGDTLLLLPAYEISADRINSHFPGQKKQILDSTALTQGKIETLNDLISRNSTLQIKQYNFGGLSTISFRGTSAEQTGIYWNGFTLNQPNNGSVDLSLIPSGYFTDVSILYGGSSSVFGSGNIGGSIHLNTEPEFTRKTRGEFNIGVGSFSTLQRSAQFTTSNREWYSSTSFIARSAENDFKFETIKGETERMPNAASSQAGIMQDIYRNFNNKLIIGAAFWYQINRREIPPSLTTKPSDISQKDESMRSMVTVQRLFMNHNKFTFRSALFNDDFRFHDPEKITSNIIDSKIKTGSINSELQYDHHFSSRSTLNTGISFVHQFGSSINWNGDVQQQLFGLFVLWSYHFPFPDLRITVNLRQNYNEDYGVPFTPSIGLEGRIWKVVYGKMALSRNFRIPTFNERFWVPGGNEDLDPETSWNQEAGLVMKPQVNGKRILYEMEFTFFNSLVDNWILWIPSGSFSEPVNIKEVWSRGVELEGKTGYKFNHSNIQFNAGYTYARSTNEKKLSDLDESYKKQLIYVPIHRLFLNLTYSHRYWFVSYNHQYTGIRYTTSDNAGFLPAYNLGNLSIGHFISLDNTIPEVRLEVMNIWNEKYQSVAYYPMPGRYFRLVIGIKLKSDKDER